MDEQTSNISIEEATAFARRYGFKSLRPEHLAELQKAMESAAEAGRSVPRVGSKFDQPDSVFRVLSIERGKQERAGAK